MLPNTPTGTPPAPATVRKGMIALTLLASMLLTACDDSNRYGDCVGVMEKRDPSLQYRLDKSNIFVAVLLSETIIVPVVVALDQLWCPVGPAVSSPNPVGR